MGTEIGSRIRKYREERKISRAALAQTLGVTLSCISNWELGQNDPAADQRRSYSQRSIFCWVLILSNAVFGCGRLCAGC